MKIALCTGAIRSAKMNKYHNHKARSVDGLIHDSRKEAKRWNELLLLQRAGQIKDLKRQVKFVLIPTQRENGIIGKCGGVKLGKVIERECCYIADFTYIDAQDKLHVEDVKGYKSGAAYTVFTIKRKLMLYIHKIRIKEI